jgi:hypothetical protein
LASTCESSRHQNSEKHHYPHRRENLKYQHLFVIRHFWNVSTLLPDYTAQHPRIRSSLNLIEIWVILKMKQAERLCIYFMLSVKRIHKKRFIVLIS